MRVSNRCYAVTGLGYLAPWCVNAGFVTGGEVTLVVDTGANALSGASIFGYATAVRPSNQLRVINTEKHFDHIGGNSFFRDRGLDVWGHASIQRTGEEFEGEIAGFNEDISSPARRAHNEARVFYGATKLANPNRPISEDTRFDIGGCAIEILLTPGHTPTNLSVWVPDDGVLFTGDCLINAYLPNLDAGTPEDWEIWLKSLDRIADLRPKAVVAGHGAVAEGDEVRRIIETVREVLQESITRGYSPTAARAVQMEETPLACNMGAMGPDERNRYDQLLRMLFISVEERRELADGYGFRLGSSVSMASAAEWMDLESKCCPFFDFHLEQERGQGSVWMRLTGPSGVKEFIRQEFKF